MTRRQEEPRAPHDVCPVCFGARKVFTFALIDGKSREAWMTCPRCNGPQRLTSGPE
jgi:hypothetical protein